MKLCFVLIQFRLLNDLKQDVISIFLFRLTHYFRHYCTLSKSSPPSASSRTMKRKLGVSITSWKTVLNNITYSRWGGSSVTFEIENHLEVDDARMAHWLEDSNFVQNRCWAENFFTFKMLSMKVLVTENCAGLFLIRIKLEQNLVPPLNVVAVVFLQMILMATLIGKKNQRNTRAM